MSAITSRSALRGLVRRSKDEMNAPDSKIGSDELDKRAADFARQVVVEPDLYDAINEIFAGTSVVEDREKVRRIVNTRAEIYARWGDARDAFLSVGRALVSLDDGLSRVEAEKVRAGCARLFPFSDTVASQLRAVARAVDNGRIPVEACPGSYATAYQVALLTDEELAVARERGLLRTNVTRSEIRDLRRESKPSKLDGLAVGPSLRERRTALKAKERDLQTEMKKLREEIERIEEMLKTGIK